MRARPESTKNTIARPTRKGPYLPTPREIKRLPDFSSLKIPLSHIDAAAGWGFRGWGRARCSKLSPRTIGLRAGRGCKSELSKRGWASGGLRPAYNSLGNTVPITRRLSRELLTEGLTGQSILTFTIRHPEPSQHGFVCLDVCRAKGEGSALLLLRAILISCSCAQADSILEAQRSRSLVLAEISWKLAAVLRLVLGMAHREGNILYEAFVSSVFISTISGKCNF